MRGGGARSRVTKGVRRLAFGVDGEYHGQLNLREKRVFIKGHKSGYLRGWSYLRTSSVLRVSTASDSMH